MSHVGLHTHEHEGHLVYTEHGRSPYFAWQAILQDGYGWYDEEVVVEAWDTTWEVEIDFNPDTGLKPKPEDAADDRMNEYWIKARPRAPDDRRKATFTLSPRWSGQETIHDEELSTPFQHDQVEVNGREISMADEGVDVEYRTSNLEDPEAPAQLFPELVQALAANADQYIDYEYFQTPHAISNVKAIEGYVRHHEDEQSRLVSSDGVLMQVFHLLGDKTGSEIRYLANNEETVGHMHKARVDQAGIGELCPGQQIAKQFKSYHPKHKINTGPLSHPKFGVLVKGSWQNGTLYWEDLEEIWQEIEEAAINVLSWSGMETGPGNGPWIGDDHFEPEESDVSIQRHENPLPAIEASQNAHLYRIFTETTPADRDLMEELAADGGEAHHVALEEATGYSSSTLYRSLQRVPELIESDNGLISFSSEKLFQEIKDILERAEREVERASDQVARLLDVDADVLDQAQDSLRRFMQEYAADIDPDGATLEVTLNAIVSEIESAYEEFPKIWIVIDELRSALKASQFDPHEQRVMVSYERPDGKRVERPIDSPRLARR